MDNPNNLEIPTIDAAFKPENNINIKHSTGHATPLNETNYFSSRREQSFVR
jgi:hypothetical protein